MTPKKATLRIAKHRVYSRIASLLPPVPGTPVSPVGRYSQIHLRPPGGIILQMMDGLTRIDYRTALSSFQPVLVELSGRDQPLLSLGDHTDIVSVPGADGTITGSGVSDPEVFD